MDGKRALVAGVPCLILRIGFVGEVGYEIHYPAAHGEHLWDAMLRGGRRRTACGRSASSPSASCACRRCTSSSGRTPTPSRRRSRPRCRGSSSSTRRRTSSASWALEHYAEHRARDRARRLHDGQRARADRGRRRACAGGVAAGQVTSVALLAAARQGHRPGLGADATSPPTTRRSRSPTTARRYDADRRRRSRSTTPRGRCCAREPRVPRARRRGRRRPHAPIARSPMERAARAAGAALRGPRRLERRGRLRVAEREREAVPRRPPAGPTSRTSASSSCTPQPPTTWRRSSPVGRRRDARARRARRARPTPGGCR